MKYREALKLTIEKFDLVQAELSRKTAELEKEGKGKKVATDQLNRYLKGKKDIYSEGLETLVRSLGDIPRAFYLALITSSNSSSEKEKERL